MGRGLPLAGQRAHGRQPGHRTQRQQIIPRALLGRVTSAVRLLFLAVDPRGVVIAGSLTAALGDPRPVFLGAGAIVVATAGAGWLAGLRPAPPAV